MQGVRTFYTASFHRSIRVAKALQTADDLARLHKLTLITSIEVDELIHIAGVLLYFTRFEELM